MSVKKKPAPVKKASKPKTLWVVVETPRGSRCKFKFDEQRSVYKLKLVLPAGSEFPYDFGFVPDTKGADGDPLDVLLLVDAPTFPGCLVEARLIGVIEARQTDDEGNLIRNDRLLAVATEARDLSDLTSLKKMNSNLRSEIELFFQSYNQARGREFQVIARKGPEAAWKLIRAGRLDAGP